MEEIVINQLLNIAFESRERWEKRWREREEVHAFTVSILTHREKTTEKISNQNSHFVYFLKLSEIEACILSVFLMVVAPLPFSQIHLYPLVFMNLTLFQFQFCNFIRWYRQLFRPSDTRRVNFRVSQQIKSTEINSWELIKEVRKHVICVDWRVDVWCYLTAIYCRVNSYRLKIPSIAQQKSCCDFICANNNQVKCDSHQHSVVSHTRTPIIIKITKHSR